MNNVYRIQKILSQDKYIIPIYQRNYAWGKAEISQLITDIDEFFDNSQTSNYYLGSLVCFKRNDGSFELIDGQQRHTTLTLINLVLKNWKEEISNTVTNTNLKFDARRKTQAYIESLYSEKSDKFFNTVNSQSTEETNAFRVAIELIREELNKENFDVEKFADNFYNKVCLFRVEVPQDTDLNHYFEIMNNRGEQLEKHEILKALLMGKLPEEKQNNFAIIWDACSEMNDYVSLKLEDFFDDNEKLKINGENTQIDKEQSLLEIINHPLFSDESQKNQEQKEKYKSVIDFPNFLLQVLSILKAKDTISLDDKKLLKEFENIDDAFSETFIYNLLKYRVLFDKYVIKQDLSDAEEEKRNWGIRSIFEDKEIRKTFGKSKNEEEDSEFDEELVKLQTMLYYSYPTNTNNRWLQDILKFLKKPQQNDFCQKFTEEVFNIAKARFNKEKLSYPEISIFNLYYIDFLLWKLYKEEVNNDDSEEIKKMKNKINNQKSLFNTFKFRQLNSKEHLAPQSNAGLNGINEEILNSIGNLCLISTHQNSQGNKENPLDKKKRYSQDNSSLKRLIMFGSFKNDKWETEQIEDHSKEIKELIEKYHN